MSNQEISKEVKEAIGTISKNLTYDSATLEKEVKEIMSSKSISDREAVRTWKATHKWAATSKEYEFIVFGLSEPRQLELEDKKTGEKKQREVSSADVLVNVDGPFKAYNIGFWDENANVVEKLSIGTVYKGRLSLKDTGYASLIGGKLAVVKDTKFPKLDDIVAKIPFTAVDDLQKHKGKFCFFSGEISGRLKDGKGVKIDSLVGFPVTVWINGHTNIADDAKEVKGFGKVHVRDDGDTMIYASTIF